VSTHNRARKKAGWMILVGIIVCSLLLAACGSQPKTYTVGIVNPSQSLEAAIDTFKAAMVELGYVEGENITYIYSGVILEIPAIEAEAKRLVDQKVDLLFTTADPATQAAQGAVEGTDIPVVFVASQDPIRQGFVQSISHPGGNLTGIQSTIGSAKALGWLLEIVPDTERVYTFYNPADQVSVITVEPVLEAAPKLGVELVTGEVESPVEELEAVRNMPEGAALLFITAPRLDAGRDAVKQLAVERGIPAGGYNQEPTGLLFTYAISREGYGEQAARLADQIFKGIKPADLPVEVGGFDLVLNLQTANSIGIEISEELLRQATSILR